MTKVTKLIVSTALASMLAVPAMAQGALVGTSAGSLEAQADKIDDIQKDVQDEFQKSSDADRFGTARFNEGWSGSLSASLAATSGNTENTDVTLGGRLNYGKGAWNHTVGFAYGYGKSGDDETENAGFVTYDANRYFTPNLYGFVLGSYAYDDNDSLKHDAFLGFGPGYRIINNASTAWRVQAGPGIRYTEDLNGNEETQGAIMASSRFYHKVNDGVFLTNDTDVIDSDLGTVATNDFGVNFKVSSNLATRVGYRTEYNSDPLPGRENTDNKLTASVVYGF